MCLHLLPENSQSKVAKKRITVYKILTGHDTNFYSPYMGMKYIKNNIYTSKIGKINKGYYFNSIEKGLHCFSNLRVANKNIMSLSEIVVRMYIPEGAIYYEGVGGNEIVTDILIWA